MFYTEIINDNTRLNNGKKALKKILEICMVSKRQVMDNFYEIKMYNKKLIWDEVERLRPNRT